MEIYVSTQQVSTDEKFISENFESPFILAPERLTPVPSGEPDVTAIEIGPGQGNVASGWAAVDTVQVLQCHCYCL